MLDWPDPCTSREFDAAAQAYALAPVEVPVKAPVVPATVPAGARIWASGLSRAQITARHIFPDAELHIDPRLNEVDLRSYADREWPLPLSVWMFRGRLQWVLHRRRQPEVRRESRARAREVLDDLEAAGLDCVLVGHGFMHSCLMREMRHRGYAGTYVQRMSNGQILVFDRP